MNLGSKNFVVCARVGGANTTPYFLTAHFAEQKILNCFLLLQNTNLGGGGKRGRAKIHSPQPPFFLPARAFRILCAARSAASCQFLGISDKMGSSQIVETHKINLNKTMAEIKQFKSSTEERPKPEKPADVVDIERGRKKEPFVFPDTESEELMETVSGLVQKLFEDSRNKKKVVEQLRNLANELEQKLKK